MSRKRQFDNAPQDAPSDPATRKRRRQFTEEDAKLAKIYDGLADEAKDIRLDAAKELVLKLSPENAPSAEFANKVLVRLIKGLCSGRKAARLGFVVALSEVLRQLYSPNGTEIFGLEPNIHGLVKLIAELTQAEGKVSGQEKRDHLLGRVFGYKAIIQSEILVQPTSPQECWANVLEQLYNLAREKGWLREEIGSILCQAVRTLAKEKSDRKLVQGIVDGLCSNNLAKTPEGVAIWLTVSSVFPQFELPQGTWHKQDPLCSKERQTLANVMRENFANSGSGAAENGKKVKAGTSQPTLNFAWEIVITIFMQKNAEKESDFSKLWTDLVDNNLFSASASPEQKSKGFQLFSKMLSSAPTWALPAIFSPNLMRCLINQRNDAERYLHNAAKAPLDEIRARVKRSPDAAAPILEGLITKHGSLNFDQITKTKTVEGALSQANDAAFEELLPLFRRLIYRPEEEDEKVVESRRRTVTDMLVSAVRSRNKENPVGDSESWLQQLLILLTELAYFTPTASTSPDDLPLPPISEGSRSIFQGRLSSCLAHLLTTKLDDEMKYPYAVVSAIRSEDKSSKSLSLVFKADKAVSKAVKQAHKQLEEIATKEAKAKEKKKPALRAFKLLFSLTILQVYNGDAEAVAILEELETCYNSAFQKGEKGSDAFQMLIEVLLGFAAKPSILFRKLSEQVFTTFASELTAEGLQSMIDILSKKESIAGQQDLFDQEASDVEEVESEDDDVEEASDVEMVDDDAEGDEGESEEGEDGSESGGEEDQEELEKFDALLAQTLKTSMPNGEGGDDEEGSDEDMDDEEMMALEPQLAKIFKERQKTSGKKKENKDAKETMINFKNRVLDLLLIYVKQQHRNILAMDLILPLLELIRSTTSKQISEKSFNLLKQYFDSAKKGLPTPSDDADVWALLKDVHTEVTKDASKLHAGACSRSSLFIAKVLTTLDGSNYEKLVDLYAETQKKWYKDQKSQVHPSFFNEWMNWSIATKKQK